MFREIPSLTRFNKQLTPVTYCLKVVFNVINMIMLKKEVTNIISNLGTSLCTVNQQYRVI